MARHRSPGGRCATPVYPSGPRAGRAPVGRRHGLPVVEVTTSAATRSGGSHRAAKPTVSGNTVVGATAALGVVVTGGMVVTNQGVIQNLAPTAPTHLTPLDLANASQALADPQPVSSRPKYRGASAIFGRGSDPVALLPAAVPSEHFEASDKRDVEMLHKAERLASEAAEVHAAASREAFFLSGGGKLDDWIRVALMKMNMSQSLAPGLKKIIIKESRGNPRAINRSDSNARAGRPSQGLMQTIPSTFRAYVLPELAHLPITNPVANITAGVRYMVANYGLTTLTNGGRTDGVGNYLGY